MRIRVSKRALATMASMCIGGLILSVGSLSADNLRSTQSVVGSELVLPYEGYLMVDGEPLTGARDIKFELYESASGGTAEWSETQGVALNNGRFSVGLGTSSPITDTLLDAEKLWIALTIIDSNTSVETPLSGRQALEPAPFAAWTRHAADFQVAGRLDVGGFAQVDGVATVRGGAVLLGGDNDGSTAALKVGRADGQFGSLLFDDDEIDNTWVLYAEVVTGGDTAACGARCFSW
ncbi:MAG: hypothetical protein AAGI01_11060 [Myxococcota bacterium]